MNNQVIQMIHEIQDEKLSNEDMVFLVQFIASTLELKTISDTAKHRGKSFNGIKNFNDKVIIGGKKFIINKKKKNKR